jgi:hypothetical protein
MHLALAGKLCKSASSRTQQDHKGCFSLAGIFDVAEIRSELSVVTNLNHNLPFALILSVYNEPFHFQHNCSWMLTHHEIADLIDRL